MIDLVHESNAGAARRLELARPRLLRDVRGTTAVESAMVAIPLFFLVLGALACGMNIMAVGVLNFATKEAARKIQIGTIRGTSDSAVRTVICDYVSAIVPSCQTALMIYAASGPTFSAAAAATVVGTAFSPAGFSTGTAGDSVVLQVACNSPFGMSLTNTANFMLTATSVFQNEPQ
ncbi:MAG TPA: TadE/TadG family type IV pilus assembly protein [Acetobacteraceae bacterium]